MMLSTDVRNTRGGGGEGEMSSVRRTQQELYIHKLNECGLSNLNALNKNKLVQIKLCSRHDKEAKAKLKGP